MPKLQETPWARISAEGVAIVVSILLAFWIQAWWEDRQESEDVRIILTSLVDELNNLNQSEKNFLIYWRAIRTSAQTLWNSSSGAGETLSSTEIDALLADFTWVVGPLFSQYPVMDSLLSTGNISLISNVNLRQELAILHSQYKRYNIVLQLNLDYHYQRQMPFLEKNANLAQIGNADDGSPGISMVPYPYEKVDLSTATDHSPLLRDAEFQNILTHRIWLLTSIDEFRPPGLNEQLVSLVALIEQELAEFQN